MARIARRDGGLVFLIRKLGKLARGSATLPQILAATVLGGMLGFVPGAFLPGDLGGGFMQAPGTIVTLIALALVLDANLAVFGLTVLLAKLVSFALLPVSFAIGELLLDGPTSGLFRVLVNAPLFAWFGLERYATTGGLALGLGFGILLGIALYRALHALRLRMARVEEGSERFRALTQKRSVRAASWLFFGGKGKQSWSELAAADRRGKGIRPIGIAAVAVLAVGLWFAQGRFGGTWLRDQAERALTYWNGATVDLGAATLDLAGGEIGFAALGMANPDRLDTDHFRARTLDFDLSTKSLLARRVVVERLTSGEAKSGVRREVPGIRVEPEPPLPAPPADAPGRGLDEWLADAAVWRDRLATAAEWIERLTGSDESPADETPAERDQRIAADQETLGLAGVVATHLFDQRPAITVRELAIDGIEVVGLDDDLIDLSGSNLSSQPALGDGPMRLSVKSRAGAFAVDLGYDPGEPGRTRLSFGWQGLSVDALAGGLKDSPIRGGTLDLRLDGAIELGGENGAWIDLPLTVTLHGTTLSVGGQSALLDTIEFPLGLSGPLRNPKVSVDAGALSDALVAAGRAELATQVRARADALLGTAIDGLGDGLGDALGGVIDGTKSGEELLDEAKRRAEEEARRKAAEQLQKRLPSGLGGLLPKK